MLCEVVSAPVETPSLYSIAFLDERSESQRSPPGSKSNESTGPREIE